MAKRKTIAMYEAEVEALRGRIEALEAENKALRAKAARVPGLEAEVSRKEAVMRTQQLFLSKYKRQLRGAGSAERPSLSAPGSVPPSGLVSARRLAMERAREEAMRTGRTVRVEVQ